jgi:spore cortex formation protein SpoVR/YcgB (stage V sporulation)
VLQHLADLWGYDVMLREVDSDGNLLRKEHSIGPLQAFS